MDISTPSLDLKHGRTAISVPFFSNRSKDGTIAKAIN